MDPDNHDAEDELLEEMFPHGTRKEFVIVAPSERQKRQRRKRIVGRFPLVKPIYTLPSHTAPSQGVPTFSEGGNKDYRLQKYDPNSETGEPGGWMLEDAPGSQTHQGTPAGAEAIQNLVVLKVAEYGKMEVYPIDEAFNFRPTVRHKVYTIEEAEMMMASKKKPKMPATLSAQMEAAEQLVAVKTEAEDSSGKGTPSHKAPSESGDDSETQLTQKKRGKKQKTEPVEREIRAARALRPVEATDALIEQIKPKNVEDWEYDEDEADDDLNMGGDFEEEEKDEVPRIEPMEAEYKKYVESDSSEEDEDGTELDEKGKELKKLIKKGAPEYVPPPPASPEAKGKRKATTEPTPPREPKAVNTAKKPPTVGDTSAAIPRSKAASVAKEASREAAAVRDRPAVPPPKELSTVEVRRFLQSSGPVPLKRLITHFRPVVRTKELHGEFVSIVKELSYWEDRQGTKIVALRPEYR